MLTRPSPSAGYLNLKGQRKTEIGRVNTVTNANEAKEYMEDSLEVGN